MAAKQRTVATRRARPSKIWWAYDFATRQDATHLNTLKILAPYLSAMKPALTPVPVLDRYHSDEQGNSITALLPILRCNERELKAHVAARLAKLRKGSKVRKISQPVLLFNVADTAPSLRDKVALISHVAQRAGAEIIAVCTHQRKGLSKFFLGSFSETFSSVSTLP